MAGFRLGRRTETATAGATGTTEGGGVAGKAVPVAARTARTAAVRAPLLQRSGPVAAAVRGVVLVVAVALTVLFAVALARTTLVPSPASRGIAHANLSPGASMRVYLDRPAVREAARQVGGNVLLGAPFGVLLPLLSRRARGLLRVTGLTVLTMVTVETAQAALVAGRAFDVDDVILNTSGAVLLYLLVGHRVSRALRRRPAPDRS